MSQWDLSSSLYTVCGPDADCSLVSISGPAQSHLLQQNSLLLSLAINLLKNVYSCISVPSLNALTCESYSLVAVAFSFFILAMLLRI